MAKAKGKMKPFNKITVTYGEKIDYTEKAKGKIKPFIPAMDKRKNKMENPKNCKI